MENSESWFFMRDVKKRNLIMKTAAGCIPKPYKDWRVVLRSAQFIEGRKHYQEVFSHRDKKIEGILRGYIHRVIKGTVIVILSRVKEEEESSTDSDDEETMLNEELTSETSSTEDDHKPGGSIKKSRKDDPTYKQDTSDTSEEES